MSLMGGRRRENHGRGAALIVAAVVAVIVMVVAAPAQAAGNVGWAWGANQGGQLGDGTTTGPEACSPGAEGACSTTPIRIKELSGVTAMSAGKGEQGDLGGALALLENGTIMGWGRNDHGQLGNGTTSDSDEPVAVCAAGETAPCANDLKEVKAVAAGVFPSLALLTTGTVMQWGELGGGEQSSVPVPVSGLTGVKAIAAGRNFSLALLENGSVMAWGTNASGQLGDGTTTSKASPVAICAVGETAPCTNALSGVVAIAAGEGHSLAVLSSGSVVAWGNNENGQLGNGTETSSDVPVQVSKVSGATAVAGGESHSLALLSNGEVRAWGANAEGQLGDGESSGPQQCGTGPFKRACSMSPVAVKSASHFTAISAGGHHSLALTNGGTVMAWGLNGSGQLGDGTSKGPEPCGPAACSTTPVAANTQGAMLGIAAGEGASYSFGPPPPPPTNLPELGRCKRVAKGTGEYKGSNCEHLAGGKGLYSWFPGAEKNKFEGSSSTTVLSTGKLTVSCSTTILEGEYTGAKTAKATLVLKGCTNTATKVKCQSKPGSEGEIESSEPLEGELGFIKGGEKPQIGVDLKKSSKATNLATFFCANGPEKPEFQANVEGSVIGQITPLKKLSTEFKLTYKGAKGTQTLERFEGGLKDTLSITFLSPSPEKPPEESASLNAALVISNEEPVQVKTATYPS